MRGARGELAHRAQRGPPHERLLRRPQVVERPPQVAHQARIVERDRRLAGEGGQEPDLALVRLVHLVPVDAHGSERGFAADHGDAEDPAEVVPAGELAQRHARRLERLVEARQRQREHVGAPHGSQARRRRPRRPLAQTEREPRLHVDAADGAGAQAAAGLVQLEDHRALTAGERHRAVDDDLEHLLQIERRGQRLADGRQRLDLGGALLRRLIVPGGIDGERDLGGDGHGEIELILPPAPLPALDEGHGADDLVL